MSTQGKKPEADRGAEHIGRSVRITIANLERYALRVHGLQGRSGTVTEFKPDHSDGPSWLVKLDEPLKTWPKSWSPIKEFWFQAHDLKVIQ